MKKNEKVKKKIISKHLGKLASDQLMNLIKNNKSISDDISNEIKKTLGIKHCVYCHQKFDPSNNTKTSCLLPHGKLRQVSIYHDIKSEDEFKKLLKSNARISEMKNDTSSLDYECGCNFDCYGDPKSLIWWLNLKKYDKKERDRFCYIGKHMTLEELLKMDRMNTPRWYCNCESKDKTHRYSCIQTGFKCKYGRFDCDQCFHKIDDHDGDGIIPKTEIEEHMKSMFLRKYYDNLYSTYVIIWKHNGDTKFESTEQYKTVLNAAKKLFHGHDVTNNEQKIPGSKEIYEYRILVKPKKK